MKSKICSLLMAAAVFSVAMSASAHDPKMHGKMMEQADCSKMPAMMDKDKAMKDPVQMAMMKKCQQQMEHQQAGQADCRKMMAKNKKMKGKQEDMKHDAKWQEMMEQCKQQHQQMNMHKHQDKEDNEKHDDDHEHQH